jgi:hypothetical protein
VFRKELTERWFLPERVDVAGSLARFSARQSAQTSRRPDRQDEDYKAKQQPPFH